jgi:hypothetical protein
MPAASELIRNARSEIVERGWTSGHLMNREGHVCALGGILCAAGQATAMLDAVEHARAMYDERVSDGGTPFELEFFTDEGPLYELIKQDPDMVDAVRYVADVVRELAALEAEDVSGVEHEAVYEFNDAIHGEEYSLNELLDVFDLAEKRALIAEEAAT